MVSFSFQVMPPEIAIRTDTIRIARATISNDGATILRLLDIVHPAAKTLVDIARAQDAEVGDGTTSVTIFAGELLKEIRPFIEDGMNPQVLVKGFRHASTLVCLLVQHERSRNRETDCKAGHQEGERVGRND